MSGWLDQVKKMEAQRVRTVSVQSCTCISCTIIVENVNMIFASYAHFKALHLQF